MITQTPRTDAEEDQWSPIVTSDFARQLETELTHALKDKDQLREGIAELNERLIERQATLMSAIVDLKTATQLLIRCRNSAGRIEMGLYEDLQNFLHTQPTYRA